ncbi:putative virion structural protein [Salmonella phage SPAsTU]|nr:putative virion structural protein [Salmonella phage SPAsTU]
MSLFGKTAKELVYDLIVAQNPALTTKGITIDKLQFGTPSNITAPDPDDEKYTRLNTSLDVTGIVAQGAFGKIGLNYRRLFVDHLFENVVISVDGTGVTKASELVPLIQAKYNWLIDASEIYATESMTSKEKHNLRFNGSSLAWIGTLEVYLTEVPSDAVDITKLITVTELDGLTYDASAS